jgi:hypothetical protein
VLRPAFRYHTTIDPQFHLSSKEQAAMQGPNGEALYDQNLTQWLQMSGEYIGRVRPSDERVAWLLFLLDEIRQFVPPAEYNTFVSELQQAIGERLRQG